MQDKPSLFHPSSLIPHPSKVDELLEELHVSGRTPEEVCRDCPELLVQVRAGWQRLCAVEAAVEALFPSSLDDAGQHALPTNDLPRICGYEVQGLLGHGGMGVVYKAWHQRLNRLVALKMLIAGAYARPEELERFQREAEAVASLRHANIVQVHDVGDLDGQPYFTMEFVEGGSLSKQLAGTPQPARAAALVATLAEAVQVAHQSGIVHRDLTPANILLTADGAPKITDFGLARRLDGGGGLTLSGIPVGTPSYMAPEQAQGQRDAIGPATDVYALGGILYEMLTGRPPFRAETATATLQQVLAEDPLPPSRLNSRVPRDLETICLKCLRKEPQRRYASARELADDLGRFGRGEPVAARPEGVAERLRKWVWRRPAAAGLLAAVALLGAAVGVGAWQLYRQQARQAQTDQEARGIVERARDQLAEGWQSGDLAKLTKAADEAKRAEDIARSGGASAAVRQEAEALREDAGARLGRAQNTRGLLDALLEVLHLPESRTYVHAEAGQSIVLPQRSSDDQYADAFRRWGLDMDGTPEAEVVARLSAEPDPVVQELIAALDSWMLVRRLTHPEAEWRRLARIADQLDRSEPHRRLRALLVQMPPRPTRGVARLAIWELARGSARRELLEVRAKINVRTEAALTVVLLSKAFVVVEDYAGAEEVLRQGATVRPDQVVWLDALGRLLEQHGTSRFADAIGYYRAARSQRPHLGVGLARTLLLAGRAVEAEEVLQELILQQPDNPMIYYFRGVAAIKQTRYSDAETASRKAIELRNHFPEACINLGYALNQQKKYGEAEEACRKAIELKNNFPEAHNNLGNALYHQKKYGEAEAAYRKAIDLEPDLGLVYFNLGITLVKQHRYSEGEAACRQAINLLPASAAPSMYNDLGTNLGEQQQYREAESAFREAIALKPDHADAYNNLGNVLLLQHKPRDAEAAYRKAIALQPDHAPAYSNLGKILLEQHKLADAEAAFRTAVALKPDFALAYNNLGIALNGQQKHSDAEAAFRKSIDLRADDPETNFNLGVALLQQQRLAQAEEAFRKATDLKPDYGLAHLNLGAVLMRQTRFHEAGASLKRGVDLLPAQDPRRDEMRRFQQKCQRYALLDSRLPAILQGTEKPANAAEQIDLAEICRSRKNYATAAGFSRDAFAADPSLAENLAAGARYNAACAAALAGCGRGQDADQLDDTQRAHWRRQALDWLRQDLIWWGKALDKGNAQANAEIRWRMRHWQADDDLAGVRVRDALVRLPDEEREQWERFWSDVDSLLRRVSEPR